MKQLGLIRVINRTSEKYYGNNINNHEKYLEDCNKYLFEYLKDTLGDGFIFSALSYINYSTEKIELVKGEDEHTKYNFNTDNERLKKELEISLKAVLNDEIIGMTAILLSKNNKRDFFLIDSKDNCSHYQNIKEPDGYIFLMPLANMIYAEMYEDFKKENQIQITDFIADLKKKANYEVTEVDKIGKYLWHYKRMSSCYTEGENKPFYVHFIRPSIIDFDHNLLLSLATNTCLTQENLAFINLFIYRIVAQMAIELKSQQADREFVDKALAYKHTIFNLFPVVKDKLFIAKNRNKIGKIKEAIKELDKSIFIWNICNRAIFSDSEHKGHPLKEKSVVEIIFILKEKVETDEYKILIDNKLVSTLLNYVPEPRQLSDIFIVFWNFCHNALKCSSNKCVKIEVFEKGNELMVSFSNQVFDHIKDQANFAVKYLKGELKEPVKEGGGHVIAKTIMNKLGWGLDTSNTYLDKDSFTVTIQIKQQR